MREPDIHGKAKAWEIPSRFEDKAAKGHVSGYLVHATWAHPFWSWWMVTTVHLRELPDMPPAHRQFEDATHELLILSLDPTEGVPDVDSSGPFVHMTPPDVIYQFRGMNDAQAAKLTLRVVEKICSGEMSPDVDYRARWMNLLASWVEDE